MSAVVHKIFSHAFNGLIWRLVPAENVLAIETRSSATREVRFSLLSVPENRLLWQDRLLEESWWVSLYGVFQDRVLIHHYSDEQVPSYSGLTALNQLDGTVCWTKEAATVQGVAEKNLVVALKEELLKIDPATGQKMESMTTSNLQLRPVEHAGTLFPVQYTQQAPYFEQVAAFLMEIRNAQPVVAMDYLEYGSFVVISYYLYQTGGLENTLLVLDPEGAVLLDEKIGENLKGVGVDPFFIRDDRLYFVKHKNELIVYELDV